MSARDPFDLIRAELSKLEARPGLVRCASVPPASAEHLRKLDAKRSTTDRIKALWPDMSWRKRARMLRVDESTLRGQLDSRVMNREPSEKVLALLGAYEQRAAIDLVIGAAS